MIPQWKLERYALGELPPSELEIIKTQIANDPEAQTRLQQIDSSNREFLQQNDPHAAAKRLTALSKARSRDESTSSGWIWKPVTAFAALAIAAFLGTNMITTQGPVEQGMEVAMVSPPDDGVRTKGLQNRIELWQKTGDSIAMILDGAKVNAGDLLQIRTQVDKKCFAAVISLDGRGNWTKHLPENGPQASAMEPGTSGFLPFSYQLDDAPRYEVFWLVTSDSAFSVDSLVKSLDALSGSPIAPPVLPLDTRFHQVRLAVVK